MDELNIDKKRYPDSAIRNRISALKNDLVVAEVFADQAKDPTEQAYLACVFSFARTFARA